MSDREYVQQYHSAAVIHTENRKCGNYSSGKPVRVKMYAAFHTGLSGRQTALGGWSKTIDGAWRSARRRIEKAATI